MKKLIFLIALLAGINSYAQKFQLGVSGGLTIANYQASSALRGNESGNPKAGFTLGLITRLFIKRHFLFQPEINWVQKGTKDKQTDAGITEKITLTTNHIEVPLNFMYASGKGFFAGGGPSFSFAVSGKVKDEAGGCELSKKVHYGNGDNDIMRGFDFGVNVLAGYKFRNNLLVSINYNLGATNLSNGSGTGTETLTSYYFGFKLGYLFNLSKK